MLARPCVYFSKWRGSWFYRLWTGQRVAHVGQELVMEGLICEHLEDNVVSPGARWEEGTPPCPSLLFVFLHLPLIFLGQSPEKSTGEKEMWQLVCRCHFLKSLDNCDADKMPRAPANNPVTWGTGRNMLGMFGWEDTVLAATVPGVRGLEGPSGQSICLLTLQDCDFPICLAVTYSKNDIL